MDSHNCQRVAVAKGERFVVCNEGDVQVRCPRPLGQSVGIAAALAIEDGVTVQGVSYDRLHPRLLDADQVLTDPGPTTSALPR